MEELEEQKMVEEDSIVEQVEESEEEKMLIEESIKKGWHYIGGKVMGII